MYLVSLDTNLGEWQGPNVNEGLWLLLKAFGPELKRTDAGR